MLGTKQVLRNGSCVLWELVVLITIMCSSQREACCVGAARDAPRSLKHVLGAQLTAEQLSLEERDPFLHKLLGAFISPDGGCHRLGRTGHIYTLIRDPCLY